MAAFVSVLEAKAKDAGERQKNDYKQVEARSHSMIRRHPAQHCSLRGLSPRPMAHKTIALTTELKEPYAGTKLALKPRQAPGWRVATFCKGLSVCHLMRPFEQGCKTAFGFPKSGGIPRLARWRHL